MELVRFPSRGGFSVRSILTFALAVFTAVLLWATFSGSPAHAATDAEWSGTSTILYDTHGYTKASDSFKDTTGTIPSGSTIYTAPVQDGDRSASQQKLFVLYFAPGVDPPTATSAKFVAFDYKDKAVSNPQNQKDISITPQSAENGTSSSCAVSGIGWIVCPVSNFLADAMDKMFGILASMIKVQPPILGDTNNSMYVAWNVMRTIANIAFVIAFLIIIYSQLTNLGVSNYGLKRLIPRLIIAAVLVNLSFVIAALAIDISNIAGYSIQDIFNGIRKSVFHLTDDNISGFNTNAWGSVTAAILAGGGLVGGVYYMATGGLYLLIPLLLGLGFTILFVVIILAARQAIILILVIISPLAFVANLLPNTEKWFDKWKDIFMTMLIFFPAFSLVFGGSQLAGQLIIQNAGDNIVTLLFGMAVQIAPLVITPLILKLSGGLLGKIAQITNNPRKGMLDRTRNWAERRAEHAKQKNMALGPRLRNPASLGAGMVRRMDYRKRRLNDSTEAWKQEATNRYEGDKNGDKYGYNKIHERMEAANTKKEAIHNAHAAHIDHLKATKGTPLNLRAVELEGAKVSAERASAELASVTTAYRAGVYDTSGVPKGVETELKARQTKMAEQVIATAAWKQSANASQYIIDKNIASSVRHETITDAKGNVVDNHLLTIAQGHGSPEDIRRARERAQAGAVATLSKLNADARSNSITLIETEAVEANKTVKDYAVDIFKQANSSNKTLRDAVLPSRLEAALEIAASDGQVSVFDDARASKFVDQAIVDAVVARHVGDMKSKGGFHIQANPQLSLQHYIEQFNKGELKEATSLEDVEKIFKRDQNKARLETLSNTNSANLGGVKFGAFAKLADDIKGTADKPSILDVINLHTGDKDEDEKNLATVRRIFESLRDGLTDPSTRATMTDRLAQAREMEELVRAKFFPNERPLTLSETERAMPGRTPNLPGPMNENPDLPTGSPEGTDSSPADEQDQ